MTVIERVKELLKDEVVENVVESRFLCGGVADVVCVRDVELLLDSLASERCVWKASDSPYYYWELSCHGGGSNDQANTSWEYCPYCGKRIEVKEE